MSELFKKGLKTDLIGSAIENGCFKITTDEERLYVDIGSKRVLISDIIIVPTYTDLIELPSGDITDKKLYFCDLEKCFYKYDIATSSFIFIGSDKVNITESSTDDYFPIIFSSETTIDDVTVKVKKSTDFKYNPNYKILHVPHVNIESNNTGIDSVYLTVANSIALNITSTNMGMPAVNINNNEIGDGIFIDNKKTGNGLEITNNLAGKGIRISNISTGNGIDITNATGKGISIANTNTSYGIYIENSSTGGGEYIVNSSTGSGLVAVNNAGGNGLYVSNTSNGCAINIANTIGTSIYISNDGAGYGLYTNNNSEGNGININNVLTGKGIYIANSGTGFGQHIVNSSTGYGLFFTNSATGFAQYIANNGSGKGITIANELDGVGFYVNNKTNGSGVSIYNTATGKGILLGNASTGYGIYLNNASTGVGLKIVAGSTGYSMDIEGTSKITNITGLIDKSTGDADGNDIREYYGRSLSLSSGTLTLKNKNGGALSNVSIPGGKTDAEIINMLMPVGFVMITNSSTNPGTLYAGTTWKQLTNTFILGVGTSYPTTNVTGGEASVTLATANLPAHTHTMAHTHTFSGTSGNQNVLHTHTASGSADSQGSHYHIPGDNASSFYITGGANAANPEAFGFASGSWFADYTANGGFKRYANTGYSGAHTHNVTTTSGNESVYHTHTYSGTTSASSAPSTGNGGFTGTAHNNMPPYTTKYIWERTA